MANFHMIINKYSFFDQDIKCTCGGNIIITIYANKTIVGLCGKCGTFPIYLEDNNSEE